MSAEASRQPSEPSDNRRTSVEEAAENKRKCLVVAGQAGIDLALAWERFMDAVRRLEEANRAIRDTGGRA